MKKYNEEFHLDYTENEIIERVKKYKDILNLNYKFEDKYLITSEWSYEWRIKDKFSFYLFKSQHENIYKILFFDFNLFSKSRLNSFSKDFSRLEPDFEKTMEDKEAIDFINKCGLILNHKKIITNNRKKILNPDADPFGEEDWGYVQENKLLKFEQFINK